MLDTAHVSNVVRQLLTQHNIGQRLFARVILNLSQGTVSELLSKPKPWTKLTEKGKESYRKMWNWAQSEEHILHLKNFSPRKGFFFIFRSAFVLIDRIVFGNFQVGKRMILNVYRSIIFVHRVQCHRTLHHAVFHPFNLFLRWFHRF